MAKIKRDMAFTEIMQNVLMSNEDVIRANYKIEDGEYFIEDALYDTMWEMMYDVIDNTNELKASDFWGEMNFTVEDDEIVVEFRIQGYDWSEIRTEF